MEKTKGKNMKIDKRSDDCVYITIGKWTVYLDNSTGEKIIDSWEEKEESITTKGEINGRP